MFESLFGEGMPLAVRFFLAFLIVLGLIGATAWAVRRFGTGRLGGTTSRGRQPRLAVIDYASVDARRRLILVRRDNVEHLLMIGGPTDVVVEANIVRAVAAPREAALPRPAAMETPRAIPLPDSGSNGSWPLQPEPSVNLRPEPANLRPAPRPEPMPEEPAAWPLQPHAETPSRAQRDTLASLADELSTRPAPPPSRPRTPAPPRQNSPRPEPRVEPRIPAEPQAAAEPATSADQSLADMAHRLEAALRKPSGTAEGREVREMRVPAAPLRTAAAEEPDQQAESAPPPPPQRAARVAEPKQRGETRQPSQSTTLYDSLEQEMASLLGRPTGKN